MNAKKAVERQTGVALWRQIADLIRLSISNGDYDQSGMVPPEIVLAAQFGVSNVIRCAAPLPPLPMKGWFKPFRAAAR